VVDGIKYAADHGGKVISLSLGGAPIVGETPQANQDLIDAVAYAYSKGSVVVAAAGNESIPLCSYPAAAQNAVCVGATDQRGAPSFYSNFPNSPDDNVGVRAPGGSGGSAFICEFDEDIWSTIWPGSRDDCQGSGSLTGYDTLAGTSMATPFVSGVAALLSAKGLTNAQILECLRTTSSNKGAYDPVYGYGIVDANAATGTCSPQSTPAFTPPSAGGGSSAQGGSQSHGTTQAGGSGDFAGSRGSSVLTVRVKRVSASRLARTRKLQVVLINRKPLSVALRAVVTRRGHSKTIARKTVSLRQTGTHTRTLKLSRSGARLLLRRGSSLKVLYRSGSIAGAARLR
jgi:subtilisin family serine protease